MNNVISIVNTTVRMDEDGRYCLNDIHKAAGGASKDQPSLFLQLDATAALAGEISNSRDSLNKTPISSKVGRYGGTYVCKELVYAYAMWISPSFSLKVIRAFKRLNTETLLAGRFGKGGNSLTFLQDGT